MDGSIDGKIGCMDDRVALFEPTAPPDCLATEHQLPPWSRYSSLAHIYAVLMRPVGHPTRKIERTNFKMRKMGLLCRIYQEQSEATDEEIHQTKPRLCGSNRMYRLCD
jgi:hypothetical protein